MDTKEKILLVQLLLENVEIGDTTPEDKVLKAKTLCKEIINEIKDSQYLILEYCCNDYIVNKEQMGNVHNLYFKDIFPFGYQNMNELHGLKHTYNDKSEEFKNIASKYLTLNIFEDWE